MLPKLLLTLIILFTACSLSASPVDRETAQRIAVQWWKAQSRQTRAGESVPIVLEHCESGYWCRHADEFLLVAADDRLPQILAHGRVNKGADMPPALAAMLRRPLTFKAYPPIGAQWQAVEPLLTTVRHQEAPYNAYCPMYRFDDGHIHPTPCVVGCVATAMEQILTYYRRTYEVKELIEGWETPHYRVDDIQVGMAVDTRLIRDNYDDGLATAEENEAVARFSYLLGQACHMDWGPSASGAESRLMAEGVKRYLGLPYVHYLDSYKYAPVAYWNFVAAEIAARRPVYYAGSIMRTGGHAFVIDGLAADGMFHVNWGYGGDYDGYFRLDVLAHPQPESDRRDEYVESGFFCNQQAIAVCPDEVTNAFVPDSLHRTGDEIVIEDVRFNQSPVDGCHTSVRLCLHNTSQQALTTPFVFLENVPTDTNRVEQARWLAMTGRTLEAGERDTVLVHTRFTRSGPVLFTISSTGENQLYTTSLNVLHGGTDLIESEQPILLALTPTTATFSQSLSNPSDTERASQNFVYDLRDNDFDTDGQIEHFYYLEEGADTTDIVYFKGLHPGHRYTLRLRRRWPIVQTLDFTTPSASGLDTPVQSQTVGVKQWFTIDGRPTAQPSAPGVYLLKEGTTFKKILITSHR